MKEKLSISNYQLAIGKKGFTPLEISSIEGITSNKIAKADCKGNTFTNKFHPPSCFRKKAGGLSLTGFTLIELMVVIAIIGILTAIMMPNVARHMEKGRQARAEADIDILVKAIALYHIDNDGTLPESLGDLITAGTGPYISDPEIPEAPWGTDYDYSPASDNKSYTIQAKKGEEVKAERIVKLSN